MSSSTLAYQASTYKGDVTRMRQLIELPDAERRELGFTTPVSILLWDFRMGVFHALHPNYGYERTYTYDFDRTSMLISQELEMLRKKDGMRTR